LLSYFFWFFFFLEEFCFFLWSRLFVLVRFIFDRAVFLIALKLSCLFI
jgi:hypothetical protein